MAGHKRKPVDLGEMADKVNTTLTKIYDLGYHDEVRIIRDFIHAEGNFFRETMLTNRAVTAELSRQLSQYRKTISIPIIREDSTT